MKKYPEFKEKFIERYSKLTDFKKFKEYSTKEQRKSIRINTLKISISEFKKNFEYGLKQIPWCKEGFFVDSKAKGLGNLFGHSMGYFYVQEASSMIPALVLNPKPGDVVLDMAAAPGSKTTHMSSIMKNKGLIVSNDNSYMRLRASNMNIQRSGITNAVITLMDGRFIKGNFDKVLLDAPCSGTGTIKKSPNTILEWNPNQVKRLVRIQKNLIRNAFEILKSGGTLVYSTCTLEPEEDEGIISWLLEEFDNAKLEKIKITGLKSSEPVLEFEGKKFNPEVKKCLRIWPQDNDSDGFFVAKIKKV